LPSIWGDSLNVKLNSEEKEESTLSHNAQKHAWLFLDWEGRRRQKKGAKKSDALGAEVSSVDQC